MIVKQIPHAFQHADKNVRAEGSALVLELYRWIGHSIDTFLEPLKPVQVKDLQEQFGRLPAETRTPKRFLRSQQKADILLPEPSVVGSATDGSADAAPLASTSPAIDPYELVDPVNVLEKIPASFSELIQSTKWSERKAALDELHGLLKVPKIQDGHFGPLIQTLSKVPCGAPAGADLAGGRKYPTPTLPLSSPRRGV